MEPMASENNELVSTQDLVVVFVLRKLSFRRALRMKTTIQLVIVLAVAWCVSPVTASAFTISSARRIRYPKEKSYGASGFALQASNTSEDADPSLGTINGFQREERKDRASQRDARPVDFPPFVAATFDSDETPSRVHLTVRQENNRRTIVSETSVSPCVPPQRPWWFGVSDGFNLDFGPIEILKKTTQETRLRNGRSYARKGSFQPDRLHEPPGLYDLSTPQCSPSESFWISIPARLTSFIAAYYAFPLATKFVDSFVTMPPSQLDDITTKFGPGISILYGTFISLTLSILYNRQRAIQEAVSIECSLLSLLTRRVVTLLEKSSIDSTLAAAQAIADQIRVLVQSSRGKELLVLMYSDPYARLGEVIDQFEEENESNFAGRVSLCRDALKDLYKIRATRLSDESLALPPTHFFILNFLTALMLLGFTANIIPTVDQGTGAPSNESCLLFALLSTIYLLFYNFAADLNGPFQGVYQIRRSTAAGHLLQMRWFLANHPMITGKINFEEPKTDPASDGYHVVTPDLGEFWFEER